MQAAAMKSLSQLVVRAALGASIMGTCANALAHTTTPPAAPAPSSQVPDQDSNQVRNQVPHQVSNQVPTPASTPVSSDQNLPPATARQQAAEITRGDPARWTREDTTSAAKLASWRKETRAALQESLGNCRRAPKAERAACNKQARDTYQQEMAGPTAQTVSGQ